MHEGTGKEKECYQSLNFDKREKLRHAFTRQGAGGPNIGTGPGMELVSIFI